ncbi:hypothetical protein Dtox_0071 [Desulfofarcimen acetoxidans DSM 771]|uniref:Peptidase MA-like domain-containing protein n=1 Tax=Desulfofarcimen acetoxidans (strain ATCC 49208 / DSM 771 / KCTC 5769 / VKM B-1644 / 5575) TaxID=485916 RepID=C8VVG9_DESAS|nr:peptidase MA family metallohydrolase [Desulfofarcimen acetoxidans]ACV61034.1 hypothetical protein Dtox_0071 [Desulfofarcimen acetoxidans DSM 771]
MANINRKLLRSESHFNLREKVFKLFAVLSVVLIAVFACLPENARGYGYSLYREAIKMSTLFNVRNMTALEGPHFVVKYPSDVEVAEARLVLNTAEKFYTPVSEDYNYSPSKKIPVIVYSSKEKLNGFFGWPASESAMGVYWSGIICVLSPKTWIDSDNPDKIEDIFVNSGPMAHEYTHLVVDYITRGNYPRWFTEGLAQYEEYKLTGFRFTETGGNLNQDLYSFNDLTQNFDYLPNQSLAYRQSFAAVKYLADNHGQEGIIKIMNLLSQGKSIDAALRSITGTGVDGFEDNLTHWIFNNISQFG